MLDPEKAKEIRLEVGQALEAFLEAGTDEPAHLSDASIEAITEMIDGFIGQEELMAVVDATLVIGHLLETQEDSPKTAKRLGDIVARQNILDAMQAVIDQERDNKAEGTAEAAETFSKFADRSEEKKAPDANAEKPKDALSLDQLNFPKRL